MTSFFAAKGVLAPINIVIIIGFIIVLINLIRINSALARAGEKLNDILHRTQNRKRVDPTTRSFLINETTPFGMDEIDIMREDFNRICPSYYSWVQVISIFPLLGLLGTVMGLIPGLGAADMSALSESLNTALYSTSFGLIAAIALKAYVTFLPAKNIDMIEISFQEIDRKFNNAVVLNQFYDGKLREEAMKGLE